MVAIRNLGHLGTPEPYRYSAQDLGQPEKETYGHKMRRLRLELALTLREVAEMAGCSKEAISTWEREKRMGNSTEAARLPRRVIALLSQRLRNKNRQKQNGVDPVDPVGVAQRRARRSVVDEPLAALPARRLRRG